MIAVQNTEPSVSAVFVHRFTFRVVRRTTEKRTILNGTVFGRSKRRNGLQFGTVHKWVEQQYFLDGLGETGRREVSAEKRTRYS